MHWWDSFFVICSPRWLSSLGSSAGRALSFLPPGMYVFGVLGINLGFHRLLTHRSFSCPLWLEHSPAIFRTCSLQFSPAFWVAVHRRHHHQADAEQGAHSPLGSFVWAHFGWLLVRAPDMRPAVMTLRYS